MDIECLDTNSWKLVDDHTRRNLEKIENNMISIKPFIRTGIDTLKDVVFMVECDERAYSSLSGSEKII